MIDKDLAELYQVETRALNQAVKRNIARFLNDFMFRLTEQEVNIMVSQNVIPSKQQLGGSLPYVFTEQGVYMLATILKSKVATNISISIMRTFVKLKNQSIPKLFYIPIHLVIKAYLLYNVKINSGTYFSY